MAAPTENTSATSATSPSDTLQSLLEEFSGEIWDSVYYQLSSFSRGNQARATFIKGLCPILVIGLKAILAESSDLFLDDLVYTDYNERPFDYLVYDILKYSFEGTCEVLEKTHPCVREGDYKNYFGNAPDNIRTDIVNFMPDFIKKILTFSADTRCSSLDAALSKCFI